jgi:hypothetical protein
VIRNRATAIGCMAVLLWALLALFTVGTAPTPPMLLNTICFAIGGTVDQRRGCTDGARFPISLKNETGLCTAEPFFAPTTKVRYQASMRRDISSFSCNFFFFSIATFKGSVAGDFSISSTSKLRCSCFFFNSVRCELRLIVYPPFLQSEFTTEES